MLKNKIDTKIKEKDSFCKEGCDSKDWKVKNISETVHGNKKTFKITYECIKCNRIINK